MNFVLHMGHSIARSQLCFNLFLDSRFHLPAQAGGNDRFSELYPFEDSARSIHRKGQNERVDRKAKAGIDRETDCYSSNCEVQNNEQDKNPLCPLFRYTKIADGAGDKKESNQNPGNSSENRKERRTRK